MHEGGGAVLILGLSRASEPATKGRRRRAFSFRTVSLGGLALAVVILGVFGLLYARFVHYERVARRHVPTGAIAAFRIEVEQAALYEPFRRHWLPLLGGPGAPPAEADARLRRIEHRVGFGRADLRELMLAIGPGTRDWVVVLGGISSGRLTMSELLAALASEGQVWKLAENARVLTHADTGVAVTVADDRAIVVASTPERALAALAPASHELELPSGPFGFVITGEAGRHAPAVPDVPAADLPGWLGRARSTAGSLEIGERVALTVDLTGADDAGSRDLARQGLNILRSFRRSDPSALLRFGRAGIDRGRLSTGVTGAGRIVLVWEKEELDAAFQAAAEALRRVFAQRVPGF